MYVPCEKLLQLQELVKAHDLRFCGNPLISRDRAYVCLSAEHLPAGGANEFLADWDRVTSPVVEVGSTRWAKLLRKLRGRLKATRCW